MDSQAIIDTLNRDVKDKTLLIRLYNLQNGVDVWIDGLCWRNYDFDLVDYFKEEFGIEIDKPLTFDVLKSDDDFLNEMCFDKGRFNQGVYDDVNSLIDTYSEGAIREGLAYGVPADKFEEAYKGEHMNFVSFATGVFDDLERPELPERYRDWIDYEKYAESLEQQYYFANGHVFDATFK